MDRRLTGPPAAAADRLAARLIDGIPVDARRLDVAGVSTALLEGGSGPPVVLLHGHGGFAESFAEVISALVDRYRVIAPDLPGLGRSKPQGAPLAPADTTQWLSQLIAATCKMPPILVGVSGGASTVARFALHSTTPTVRQLVLASPGWVGSIRLSLSVRAALARFRRNPSRVTAARVARHLLFDANQVRARLGRRYTAIEDYLIERARQPGVQLANRALTMSIATDQLRQLPAPVALICGRHDPLTPIGHTQRLSAELGWPLAVIEGAGHLPHLEQPNAFAAALSAAIDPNHQPPKHKENP